MTSQIVWYKEDSKKGKLMHSVSVCPCLSETVHAHTFCMWLHCFDMLLCSYLQMKTANSLSWGGSPTSCLTLNTCSVFFHNHMKQFSIWLGDGAWIFLEGPGMHVNDGTIGWRLGTLKSISLECRRGMSWTGDGISHLSSRDVHGVSLRIRTAVSTQWRITPMCEQVSADPAIQVQCATSTVPYSCNHTNRESNRPMSGVKIQTFRPNPGHHTLRWTLVHLKDPTPLRQRTGVVDQIPCSNCEKVYIGQTDIGHWTIV